MMLTARSPPEALSPLEPEAADAVGVVEPELFEGASVAVDVVALTVDAVDVVALTVDAVDVAAGVDAVDVAAAGVDAVDVAAAGVDVVDVVAAGVDAADAVAVVVDADREELEDIPWLASLPVSVEVVFVEDDDAAAGAEDEVDDVDVFDTMPETAEVTMSK